MSSSPQLLTPDDPPPFRALNPEGAAPILLLCDHAANAVPRKLGALGLPAAELGRHIGWDIGAEALTRRLSERLDAVAVMSSFSRLVIDCNRALGDPTSIPRESDGSVVPGNAALTPADRAARAEAIYWPYHHRVKAELDRFAARGVVPIVLSMHSFTPHMNGFARPWQIGVLWDVDSRISTPLMRALSEDHALTVGDNEPYSLRGPVDFTLPYHVVPRGLAHALLEIRQDEITTPVGVSRYAEIIALTITPILRVSGLFQVRHDLR